MTDEWQPNFQLLSPGYEIFSWLDPKITSKKNWLTPQEFNQIKNPFWPLQNQSALPIKFVNSNELSLITNYEATIFLTGKVSTRKENWHDFFNMLIWQTFPLGKAKINALHYQQMQTKTTNTRTPFENLLTLFDENGVIVISSDQTLLSLIKNMSWKEFFWTRRAELLAKVRCYIFGHSLHEKLLRPYVGLVGHCVLMDVEEDFFRESNDVQMKIINQRIQAWLIGLKESASPRDLFPLPLLGFPGWFEDNDCEDFYDNINYFRSSRCILPSSCKI